MALDLDHWVRPRVCIGPHLASGIGHRVLSLLLQASGFRPLTSDLWPLALGLGVQALGLWHRAVALGLNNWL